MRSYDFFNFFEGKHAAAAGGKWFYHWRKYERVHSTQIFNGPLCLLKN